MEKDRWEFLKKMRNPRADALQKSDTMKKVRDKCKLSCCPRCDCKNGKISFIVHNNFTLGMSVLKPSYCL
jgi:hypothetical protein